MAQPANLGPRGARRRAGLGATALIAAALVLVPLAARGAPVTWMGPGFLLLWLGGLGVLQARAKT